MKISEITTEYIRNYLRLDDESFDNEIGIYKAGAIDYIKGKTNLSDEELETHEDITIALLVLISDMFENHLYHQGGTGSTSKSNLLVDNILNQYAINLL